LNFIGFVFVAGKASPLSQTFNRDLLVSIESEGGASQFIKLKLRAKPAKEDEEWSDWMTARERADLSPVPEGERMPSAIGCSPKNRTALFHHFFASSWRRTNCRMPPCR
jgi:hypothetical protein